MDKSKFKFVWIIIFLIIFISGSFITLDWARLFIVKEELKYHRFLYTYIAKFLIVILSTTLVFIIGKNGLSYSDTKNLKFIYIFIILADISLVIFKEPYIGIILFSIVQLRLISRNGSAILKNFTIDKSKVLSNNIFINIVLATVLFMLIIMKIANNLMKESTLFYILQFYVILLSTSLLIAIANLLLKIFPRPNSILVTIGMFFFVLCDLNVGLTMALQLGNFSLITDSLIWMFYTPALTLIALSGYNYYEN
ncbi:hypothetical protein KQI38_18515 [Tissierella carlieri]|uniref:YhhN-like protein n=1 Tax=Tissierella carlieri TaxID=689904 RepID=A0ABT1S691_9FIRM|nr:hypothetical protein [Tissierella carlieri]MBU5314027.1 hypothetical protein [Tissierella carlieri]MCQ4921978.1 hypothetical protein [Tissierella carlieri]